eukprot:6190446-Pleurochrysis_carterae.AAC.1
MLLLRSHPAVRTAARSRTQKARTERESGVSQCLSHRIPSPCPTQRCLSMIGRTRTRELFTPPGALAACSSEARAQNDALFPISKTRLQLKSLALVCLQFLPTQPPATQATYYPTLRGHLLGPRRPALSRPLEPLKHSLRFIARSLSSKELKVFNPTLFNHYFGPNSRLPRPQRAKGSNKHSVLAATQGERNSPRSSPTTSSPSERRFSKPFLPPRAARIVPAVLTEDLKLDFCRPHEKNILSSSCTQSRIFFSNRRRKRTSVPASAQDKRPSVYWSTSKPSTCSSKWKKLQSKRAPGATARERTNQPKQNSP